MPQPCSQPLAANPFESYRDPETGQWKVKYPSSALPPMPQPLSQTVSQRVSSQSVQEAVQEKVKLAPKLRRWEKSSQTKVA